MFFKFINGRKFYCNEKGELTQKDGANVEVPETDTAAVDIDSGVDEATKMLSEAMQKAIKAGDAAAVAQLEKATEAVTKFFDAVAEKASARTTTVELPAQKSPFDADAVLDQAAKLSKTKGSLQFKFKSLKDLDYLAKTSTSRVDLDITDGDTILPDNDPEITRDPQRDVFMEQIGNVVPINSDTAQWTEVVSETGTPLPTSELNALPKGKKQFKAFRSSVENIGIVTTHSKQLLDFGPALIAALREMFLEDLRIEVDEQILAGNGTSPELQGVLGVAEVLDATAIGAQRKENANIFDVLRIGYTKIAVAGKRKFRPNYVIMHETDIETLDLTKDAEGRYLLPPFFSAGNRDMMGVRVLGTTAIAQGTFLLGDFRRLNIRPFGGVEVDISNSNADDFEKNLISIRMQRQLTSYVKTNHSGAFLTGNFDTVIDALLAPAA